MEESKEYPKNKVSENKEDGKESPNSVDVEKEALIAEELINESLTNKSQHNMLETENIEVADKDKLAGETCSPEDDKRYPICAFAKFRRLSMPTTGKEENKEQAGKAFCIRDPYKNKELYEVAQTSIMEPYYSLNPTYGLIWSGIYHTKEVYKVTLENGMELALKVILVGNQEERKISNIIKEYNIARVLSSMTKHVIKVLDIKQKTLERKGKVVIKILMEYGGESLEQSYVHLDEKQLLNAIYQLIHVMELMEKVGISHFDIKPANLVWDPKEQVLKLIDFGASISFYTEPDRIKSAIADQLHRITGYTRNYAPPELLAFLTSKGLVDIIPQKVDIFCFGMTFFSLLTSFLPINLERASGIEEHTKLISFVEENLAKANKEAFCDLIISCLSYDPKNRPSLQEIKEAYTNILIKLGYNYIISMYENKEAEHDYNLAGQLNEELGEYEAAIYNYKKYLSTKEADENIDRTIQVYNCLGRDYAELGMHKESCKWLKRGVALCLKSNDKNNELLGKLYHSLAVAYLHKANYETALKYCYKVEVILKSIPIIDKPALAQLYNILGIIYKHLGGFEKSIVFHKNAISLKEELYGKGSKEIAESYSNLGSVYHSLDKYQEALEWQLKAIEIIKDKENAEVATLYSNLGTTYYVLEESIKALECHAKAKKIWLKTHGEDCLGIATAYTNIGSIQAKLGDYDKANKSYETARSIRTKLYGEIHPEVAAIYNNMAVLCNNQGKKEEAISHTLKALDIKLKVYQEVNPDVATTYNNLGTIYNDLGEYEEAMKCHCKALQIRMQIYGIENKSVADSYINLGTVYEVLAMYDKAIKAYTVATSILQKLYGEQHALVANAYNNLGQAYINTENYGMAMEYLLKAAGTMEKSLHENHPKLAIVYNNLGGAYHGSGELHQATKYYKRSIKMLESNYGEKYPQLSVLYNNLAILQKELGDLPKATKYLKKAIRIEKAINCKGTLNLASLYANLAEIYSASENHYKVKRCHDKAQQFAVSNLTPGALSKL